MKITATCETCDVDQEIPEEATAWKCRNCDTLNDLSGRRRHRFTSDVAGALGALVVGVIVFLIAKTAFANAFSDQGGRLDAAVILALGATAVVYIVARGLRD